MKRCGAKTKKDGSPCRRSPVKGSNRCKLHGGLSLKGTDSPTYKHGLYSKYAGDSLKQVISELDNVDSEELINPQNEIKLLQALIVKCKGLKDGTDSLNELDTISKIIERLIHAKQRSQKIMLEQERLVPAGDIKIFLNFIETTLVNFTGHDEASSIMNELTKFKISTQN